MHLTLLLDLLTLRFLLSTLFLDFLTLSFDPVMESVILFLLEATISNSDFKFSQLKFDVGDPLILSDDPLRDKLQVVMEKRQLSRDVLMRFILDVDVFSKYVLSAQLGWRFCRWSFQLRYHAGVRRACVSRTGNAAYSRRQGCVKGRGQHALSSAGAHERRQLRGP